MKKYKIDDMFQADRYIAQDLQETIQHGDRLFPCASYMDHYFDGQSFYPWHWHKEFEITYVTQGSVTVSVNEKQYVLSSGNGIFISSQALHSFSLHGREKAIMPNIVFLPVLLYGTGESVFWEKYMKHLLLDNAFMNVFLTREIAWQAKLLDYAQEAFDCLTKEEYGYEFRVRSLLSEIALLLLENRKNMDASLEKRNRTDINRLRTMLLYIQTHYTEPVSVQQIAGSAFISSRECIRCFKKIVGITPIQYVIEMRIQKAKQLLLETELPMLEVGISCGFEDQSYFTKVFRQKTGITPFQYRKQQG